MITPDQITLCRAQVAAGNWTSIDVLALLDEIERLRILVAEGYELSTYAACVHWDGSRNTRSYLSELRNLIQTFQRHAIGDAKGLTP